ncbi:MAG: NUDIX hydrolase [Deltaproteobacteria bacterium]|nr:NUDIX hydrolase [Deltaproteobacteria bacterium]
MLASDADGAAIAPRDAATVLLLRDHVEGGFEIYLVRRHAKSGFMAGAHVFPGGKVDAADGRPSMWERVLGLEVAQARERLGESLPDERVRALFVAAARETFEEAGVLLGAHGPAPKALRERANAGESFEALLVEAGIRLSLGELWPYSRWITPEAEPRRYDARFFLARVPREQRAAPDLMETTAGAWMKPREALDAASRGEIALPPPTLRSLENLALEPSAERAIERARERRPPVIAPRLVMAGQVPTIVLPGDPEHPISRAVLPGSTRIALVDGRWVSQDVDS